MRRKEKNLNNKIQNIFFIRHILCRKSHPYYFNSLHARIEYL